MIELAVTVTFATVNGDAGVLERHLDEAMRELVVLAAGDGAVDDPG